MDERILDAGASKMQKVENDFGFKDILLERRLTSDILWVSRAWNPVPAYVQPHKSSATEIKSKVFHSYRLKQVIDEISHEEKVPHEELYKRVQSILNEMGYNREVPVLRWLGLFTAKILKKLCSSVLVNENELLQIKSEMGKNPVLFVPSHRSYGDFILMSYICFHYDLDIPRIAAGMDFHSMMIMGRVLRDSCAFFMRRSFNNDKLYTAVFSQYVQTLITDGDAAVEFFIEGTRSRTGKCLTPKFGFLTMALKPFLTGLVPDISVVPINLSYDRTLEELLFAYELLGVPKPKESTKGFFKALSILNENYGSVYVRFGKPFSVKDYFGSKVDRSLHSFGPVQLQDLTSSETKRIVRLAHAIVDEQRKLTVLTCFNLIAAVLNDNIVNGKKPLTLDKLISEVAWLRSVLNSLNVLVLVEGALETCILRSVDLHKNLVSVSRTKEVRLCRIHNKGAVVDVNKLKGHDLSDATMDVAVPLVAVQNYVNPCIYFVIYLSLLSLIIECSSKTETVTTDDLFRDYLFLRSIFSYEFVFRSEFEKEDFEKALKNSQELKMIASSGPNSLILGENEKLRKFCINILASFIPGYITAASVLLENSDAIRTESDILKNCQSKMESNLKEVTVFHPNNLSLDVLSNALQAFVSLGFISKSKGKGEVLYSVKNEKLHDFYGKFSIFDVFGRTDLEIPEMFSTFVSGKL